MTRTHVFKLSCLAASIFFFFFAHATDAKHCLRMVVGASCHCPAGSVSFESLITEAGAMKNTRPLPPHTSEPYQRAASCMEGFQSYYLPIFRRSAPAQGLPSTFVATWQPINDGCDL